jgi:hypothetical protein
MIEEAMAASSGSIPADQLEITFDTTASFGQEVTWWTQNSPDCLIICLPSEDLMQGYFLTKLRTGVPKTLPILLLSPFISSSLMQLSQTFSKVRLLKTPVEGLTVLRTIIDITTQWNPDAQQVHPRYQTDQVIVVSSDFADGQLQGKMRNLSLSGAYFETSPQSLQFKSGDLVKVTVNLGKPPKEYLFDARVVWIKNLEGENGHGYGITFVNKEEVFNHLLRGL